VDRVFDLLLRPESIRHWWGAARAIVLPERGGTWAAAWGDDENAPDYISVATILELERPNRLVLGDFRYYAKTGKLPFDAQFVTEFVVSRQPGGASLQVTQDGFPGGPEADEYYSACETGWRDTFAGIRKFLDDSEDVE